MTKQMERHDTGWVGDGEHPVCPEGKHPAARLVSALDFSNGYVNTYECTACKATRTISGPRGG